MAGTALVSSLVILRIVSASWLNVLQKKALQRGISARDLAIATWGWMALFSAPTWILAGFGTIRFTFPGTASFWWWIILAMLLEIPGNWLLLRSLRRTDLSIYGPLNSFKPVVSLFTAVVLLSEWPSAMGWMGLGVVLIGSIWLADPIESDRAANWKTLFASQGTRDRLLAMILTATASVFLKRAMEEASPLVVLAAWSVLGWAATAVGSYASSNIKRFRAIDDGNGVAPVSAEKQLNRVASMRLALIAAAMLAMQAMTMALFQLMPVAYALALFQLGSLVSVYLGHRLFSEPHVARRLIAAVVMVVGAVILLVAK